MLPDLIAYSALDIGSTTVKYVLLDNDRKIVFSEYIRHNGSIYSSIESILNKVLSVYDNLDVHFAITGSAGMGLSEKHHLPFIQEVIAAADAIKQINVQIKTLIDVGGEDTKLIYFDEQNRLDMRMNGNCAGGTGAFLDQMAILLNLSLKELDILYHKHKNKYPIASRCGVFAKTDVQNLLTNNVPIEDIAASIFHAVALQAINSLSRGRIIEPKIIFCGGPLAFLSGLRDSFLKILSFDNEDVIIPRRPELIPAIGAAITKNTIKLNLKTLSTLFKQNGEKLNSGHTIEPLFNNQSEYMTWINNKSNRQIQYIDMKSLNGKDVYLGIDAGSTTTKIVLIDKNGRIAFRYYANNNGNLIKTVTTGLQKLHDATRENECTIHIKNIVTTGYGEELIQKLLEIREGVVETIAHYRAAKHFCNDLSFILDIGGQDIKAIFLNNGIITNIEINEACSSGCGSFIETFSRSLNYDINEFAQSACRAKFPSDLGTRCTVFMNSKVKQSYKEGATIEEISAGLAYSVIKNCFNKVLKINDPNSIGKNIVVQGGTFKNPAILRALEKYLNRNVICPDICELMGAYGAALVALDKSKKNKKHTYPLSRLITENTYKKDHLLCKGCENTCRVTKLTFLSGETYFTGNRCENKFNNRSKIKNKGINFTAIKYELLFKRKISPGKKPIITIGIPRVLNMYENFPFWCALFVESGIEVVLSSHSTNEILDKGLATIMSDNICFPAKLAHGHIMDLIEKKVDRIFYPIVNFENKEFNHSVNSYNCPVVTGYPEVIRSSINPDRYKIPFDTPHIVFNSNQLLRKACYNYLKKFGISKKVFSNAYYCALHAQAMYRQELKYHATRFFEQAKRLNKMVILLTGRPYHLDPLINHKIPELITQYGIDVVTDDIIPDDEKYDLSDIQVLSQWEYSNRLYNAAKWAANKKNIQYIQLNSFGCGPDAIAVDEVKDIFDHRGKISTFLRIDEILSIGSVKLRIRSLIESLKYAGATNNSNKHDQRIKPPIYSKRDRKKVIIAPNFAPNYSIYLESIVNKMGYKLKILPLSDRLSVDIGLKYANNDICYPAVICIGDILKALSTGEYDINNTAVAISETGGPCRASNYASLLKKALLRAGYNNIPVITLTSSKNSLNLQPGFKISNTQLNMLSISGLLYTDTLMKMYYSIATREINKGEAGYLVKKYLAKSTHHLGKYSIHNMFKLLERAVNEFNRIKTIKKSLPKIGLVGEIYVKYNPFGNHSIVDWLIKEGIEVVIPPLLTFFLENLVDIDVNQSLHIKKSGKFKRRVFHMIEQYVNKKTDKINQLLDQFRHPVVLFSKIRELAEKAEHIISLGHQYGEGWLIAAEISAMVEAGIHNIISLQPFGCIANHIVAKGIERKIKEQYPNINLLFLDLDPGVSDVNIHNRLHFMIKNARQNQRASHQLHLTNHTEKEELHEQTIYSL